MQNAYHLGGWGMYPTTIFGFVLLAFAVQYARNPERRRLLVLRHLNVLVAMSGLLGFTAGCINTFTHVEGDKTFVAIIGVGESLVNVGLSLCMLILARMIMAFGTTFGAARDADSALLDPRAP
ncbi:MAG TPA: hypothetical protein VIV11_28830 [Kofleriaceae bacterium]